jgi:hypothetical protein
MAEVNTQIRWFFGKENKDANQQRKPKGYGLHPDKQRYGQIVFQTRYEKKKSTGYD